jgi:hypothetical protein
MFGCQQILISPDTQLRGILEFLCGESNKLHNCGTYLSRQLYFKTGKVPSKFDLHRELKSNKHFQAMYSHVSQQCLTTVAESFKSYFGLLKGIKKGTVTQKPKLPNYRSVSRLGVKLNHGLAWMRFICPCRQTWNSKRLESIASYLETGHSILN